MSWTWLMMRCWSQLPTSRRISTHHLGFLSFLKWNMWVFNLWTYTVAYLSLLIAVFLADKPIIMFEFVCVYARACVCVGVWTCSSCKILVKLVHSIMHPVCTFWMRCELSVFKECVEVITKSVALLISSTLISLL